jgi:hypothetical protein
MFGITSSTVFGSLLALCSTVSASALLPVEARQTPGCVNGPTSRKCWTNGFNINTDPDVSWPTSGGQIRSVS